MSIKKQMERADLSDDDIRARLGEEEEEETRTVIVEGASGGQFRVLTDDEASWFNENMKKYMEEYRFENVADLQDLDRLLGLELLSYRYANWLISGSDYFENIFDEKGARESKQKIDQEIRLSKSAMGMSRKARIEDETQSTSDYLTAVKRRAREFGIHRDNQIAKAIDLWMEIKKLVLLHDRCDEEERKHLGVEIEDIIAWVRDVGIPEFDEIDIAFRKNQRLWIKEVS